MATIRQVAQIAQVSPGTVSQLLNGRAKLRPETRQRIESAIDRLGYQRRPAGRPSAVVQRHHIGMLLDRSPSTAHPRHPLDRRRVNHLRKELLANGDQFSLLAGGMPPEENWALDDALASGHLDAVVMDGNSEARGYARWFRARGVPHVVLERTPQMNEFSCVCVDSVRGGQLAAEHLAQRGRVRFAFVQPILEFSWTRERRHGFVTTLEQQGRTFVDAWKVDPDGAEDQWQRLCRQLLERRIDGVFASSDSLAVRLTDTLQRHDAAVPEDVAIVGFDNLDLRSESGLRPTSVAYDHRHVARAVIRTLKQLIDEPFTSVLATYIRPALAPHDTA
ncbi:MAG: LacI family DNA-binding transcriptional regulator [Phycisphaeraceae bacterium]